MSAATFKTLVLENNSAVDPLEVSEIAVLIVLPTTNSYFVLPSFKNITRLELTHDSQRPVGLPEYIFAAGRGINFRSLQEISLDGLLPINFLSRHRDTLQTMAVVRLAVAEAHAEHARFDGNASPFWLSNLASLTVDEETFGHFVTELRSILPGPLVSVKNITLCLRSEYGQGERSPLHTHAHILTILIP